VALGNFPACEYILQTVLVLLHLKGYISSRFALPLARFSQIFGSADFDARKLFEVTIAEDSLYIVDRLATSRISSFRANTPGGSLEAIIGRT